MISFTLQNSPRAYSLVYEALSIGTAPNVPYLNLHKIGNRHGSNGENNDGYAINAGMRGVKYGQSLNYSYWTSKDQSKNIEIAMHSIGSLVNLYGVTVSLEGVSLFRDDKSSSSKLGGVVTGEVYVKTWRENYIHLSYAQANTTEDLLPGSANQLRIGLKSFIIPGVELATYFENENQKNKESGSSLESSGVSGNLHAYF